jgi:hypothetical protein
MFSFDQIDRRECAIAVDGIKLSFRNLAMLRCCAWFF